MLDGGAQISVLSRTFDDSLGCKPKLVVTIWLTGASPSGVIVARRVDIAGVEIGEGNVNYSMTIYVAELSDN